MNAFVEIAESIIEHAEAIARLDPRRPEGRAGIDEHIHAIRVLASPHVATTADRAFFKTLERAALRTGVVYAQMHEGVIEFLVDTRGPQVRFELWTTRQMRDGG